MHDGVLVAHLGGRVFPLRLKRAAKLRSGGTQGVEGCGGTPAVLLRCDQSRAWLWAAEISVSTRLACAGEATRAMAQAEVVAHGGRDDTGGPWVCERPDRKTRAGAARDHGQRGIVRATVHAQVDAVATPLLVAIESRLVALEQPALEEERVQVRRTAHVVHGRGLARELRSLVVGGVVEVASNPRAQVLRSANVDDRPVLVAQKIDSERVREMGRQNELAREYSLTG